jgi:hypothetical protein
MSRQIRVSTNSSTMLPMSIQPIHDGRSVLSSAYPSIARPISVSMKYASRGQRGHLPSAKATRIGNGFEPRFGASARWPGVEMTLP